MAQTLILCGSRRSDRSQRVQQILEKNYPSAILIVPTRQYARKRSIELLNGIGKNAIDRNLVSDFTQFTQNMLEAQNLPIRLLDEWEQVLIIRSIILSAEGKKKFEPYKGLLAPENLARSFYRIIRNLKQAGITPEDFEKQVKVQTIEPWDEVVCWVYAEYQNRLLENNWYDIPGLFWQAEIECQKGKPNYVQCRKILLFDGFDDFTNSELRLIKSLCPYFEKVIIGINYDANPSRQDVYHLAKDALERLQLLLEAETVCLDTPTPKTSIEFVADSLFWRDEPKEFVPISPATVRIQRYINREEEIKSIGREVKRLLVEEKVPLQRIAVVYRQMETVRPILERVMKDYGIPVKIQSVKNLRDTVAGQFLERVFAQMNETTLSAITFLLHDTIWNVPVSVREKFFVILKSVGLSTYMPVGYVREKIKEEYYPEQLEEGISEEDIKEFYKELHRWLDWRDKFPNRGSVSDYISVLLDLFRTLEQSFEHCLLTNKEDAEKERKGYIQIVSLLQRFSGLFGNQEVTFEEFQRVLLSVIQEVPFFVGETGYGVLCTDLPMIRNMEYDYLFVGGVEEGVVPLTPSLNVIYSDKDITAMRKLGLQVDDVAKQIQREWLFFQQIFESVKKGIYLSNALYSETHEERSGSLLLREVQELCAYIRDGSLGNEGKLDTIYTPCSSDELRNLRFYYGENEEILKVDYPEIYSCWYALLKREEGGRSIYTGDLQAEDIHKYLIQKFGERHIYSVDQIEEYVECPFTFWAHRILNLKDWEEEHVFPSPLMVGYWAHEVLYEVMNEHYDKLLEDREAFIRDELKGIIENTVRKDRRTYVFTKRWIDITIEWLMRVLAEFLRSEYSLIEEIWRPSYFEIAFGRTKYEAEDEKSLDEPYRMNVQDKTVLFSGRVDRIDKYGEEPLLRVVDYKWGKTPTAGDMGVKYKKVQERMRSFQLLIYELAMENHLFRKENYKVGESCFISITERKKSSAPWQNGDDLRLQVQSLAEQIIYQTIENIHQGKFSPEPYNRNTCDFCSCRIACRVKEKSESGGDNVNGETEIA